LRIVVKSMGMPNYCQMQFVRMAPPADQSIVGAR
jgi:hypothetical protein